MRNIIREVLLQADDNRDALFDCEDVDHWPEGIVAHLEKAGLLKLAETASRIRCNGCERDCLEEVVVKPRKGKKPLAVIYCREDPDIGRVTIDFDRLRRWRVDWGKICESVLSGLEASGPIVETAPGRMWNLGRSQSVGQNHPLLIYIGMGNDDASDLLRGRLGANPGARPVMIHAGDMTAELAEAKLPCFFIPLSECLDVRDDQLFVDTEFIASMVKSQDNAFLYKDEPYVFRNRGDSWDVRFEIGELKPIKDNAGMKYIAFLLSKPHEPFAAVEIDQLLSGNDEYPMPGSSGPSTDQATIQDVKREIRDLEEEIIEAEANGQESLAQKYRLEKEQREDYLSACLGLNGKPRQDKSDADNVRKKLLAAISRAIKKIRKHNTALADHFDRFIDTGTLISYQPTKKITWLI